MESWRELHNEREKGKEKAIKSLRVSGKKVRAELQKGFEAEKMSLRKKKWSPCVEITTKTDSNRLSCTVYLWDLLHRNAPWFHQHIPARAFYLPYIPIAPNSLSLRLSVAFTWTWPHTRGRHSFPPLTFCYGRSERSRYPHCAQASWNVWFSFTP